MVSVLELNHAQKQHGELNSIASKIMGAVSRTPRPATSTGAPLTMLEAPKKSGMASAIAPDMTILGNIVCEGGPVQILGCVKGELRISDLVVGVGGLVEGDVYALTLVVQGTVNGTIHANDVKLLGTSTVKGDIFHQSMTVERDALFEGLSRRMENEMVSVKPRQADAKPSSSGDSKPVTPAAHTTPAAPLSPAAPATSSPSYGSMSSYGST